MSYLTWVWGKPDRTFFEPFPFLPGKNINSLNENKYKRKIFKTDTTAIYRFSTTTWENEEEMTFPPSQASAIPPQIAWHYNRSIEEARSFWWFLFHSRFTKLDYTLLPTILTEYSMGTAKASRFCGNVSSYSQDSVWSWFICLCSSICMMLTLGFSFALGVLFPVLMNSFNENRERTGKMNHFITYFRR